MQDCSINSQFEQSKPIESYYLTPEIFESPWFSLVDIIYHRIMDVVKIIGTYWTWFKNATPIHVMIDKVLIKNIRLFFSVEPCWLQ